VQPATPPAARSATPSAAGRTRVDERAWRYADVECERCRAVVQVAKFSLQHTTVQWTAQAVLSCAEFSASVGAGGTSALIATCASLRASIDRAVADGQLEVLPP
jgi:hypothetical protein